MGKIFTQPHFGKKTQSYGGVVAYAKEEEKKWCDRHCKYYPAKFKECYDCHAANQEIYENS